jgi:Ca2+/H+ antiporter, TMEM165/GDT1 family
VAARLASCVCRPIARSRRLDPFLLSTFTVALAEMGDKTQLLALVLAARWRKPLVIVLGILAATLANHALAAGIGSLSGAALDGTWLTWILGLSFVALGLWSLIPDAAGEEVPACSGWSCFWATTASFFLAEMGDKTQLATVALAAQHHAMMTVTAGSTLGLLLANAPAVYAGQAFAGRLPLRALRIGAALLFVALGLWNLVSA